MTIESSQVIPNDLAQQLGDVWVAIFGDSPNSHNHSQFNAGRFSITTGEACHQAQFASVRELAVFFDGVLYNPQELRNSLPATSEPADNDADLLLHAFRHWGEELVTRAKGLFSLLVWDSQQDCLLVVRDPLGLRPLFYREIDGTLFFSTSIDALNRCGNGSVQFNREALAEHICHRWLAMEETYYANVHRFPPGHLMKIVGGRRSTTRYWDPARDLTWICEDELDRFDGLFEQAVQRCIGTGDIGIYLSGGFDSVSVAAIAARACRQQGRRSPLALSLAFPPPANEEEIQRGVAASLGLTQVIKTIDETIGPDGLLSDALEINHTRPSPLFNLWTPSYYQLGLRAREDGCNVILTGNGGDEWLEVSPLYAADLLRTGNLSGFYRLWKTMGRSWAISRLTATRAALWTFGLRAWWGGIARRFLDRYSPRLLHAHRVMDIWRTTPRWVAADNSLRRSMFERREARMCDMHRFEVSQRQMHPSAATYVAAMRRVLDEPLVVLQIEEFYQSGRKIGVPLAHPYWDVDLVDFLYRVPPRLLQRGERGKSIVRSMVASEFPGLNFEKQRKLSAQSFYQTVMRIEGRRAWKQLGGATLLADLGVVEPKLLNRHMERLFSARDPLALYHVWYVLSLESWVRGHA